MSHLLFDNVQLYLRYRHESCKDSRHDEINPEQPSKKREVRGHGGTKVWLDLLYTKFPWN